MADLLKITLKRSRHGRSGDQRRTLAGLGLRKIGQTVLRPDTPSIRGMVTKVAHLVAVEEVRGEARGQPRIPQ
jgi:large subunit ribosomal protein L30